MAVCGSGRSTTHAVDTAAMASDASNGADTRMVVLRGPADTGDVRWLGDALRDIRIPEPGRRLRLLDDVDPHPRRIAQRKPSLPPWLVAQLVDEWRPCLTESRELGCRVLDLEREEDSG